MKHSIPIEVVTIGFSDFASIEKAIKFLNNFQDIFTFKILHDQRFENYQSNYKQSFQTSEIYRLIDEILSDLESVHHLIIGIVNKRLDGKTLGNLFSSMETRNDDDSGDNLTGKAITTIYQVNEIIYSIPIEIYYIFKFVSFAIRFVVKKGLIHDNERGCIFHRMVNKRDILEAIKSGYISLESQKKINEFLELNQIIQFKTVLSIIGDIARSESPEKSFNSHLDKFNETINEKIKGVKIFISYAKEDFEKAKKIYEILRDKKFRPWIDEVDLLPGQNWEFEIKKAIKECDYFIACISNKSVFKNGFYQTELKKALEILDSKPDETIYLIPLRLEECPIPQRFEKIHYCDSFKENGIEKLITAISYEKVKLKE